MLADPDEQFPDDNRAHGSRIWHHIFYITQVPFAKYKMGLYGSHPPAVHCIYCQCQLLKLSPHFLYQYPDGVFR